MKGLHLYLGYPKTLAKRSMIIREKKNQGRLAPGDDVTLDRQGLPPLTPECFPAGEDGLNPRFAVVIAGPGDTVTLPSLAIYPTGR